MREPKTYGVGELAELGGVSRRTVRYYVQEGLLPAPFGLGRGRHYGDEHLDRVLRVKALQEEGKSLDEIRVILSGRKETDSAAAPVEVPREVWVRVEIEPGIELHVSSSFRLPSPGRLAELADACRRALHRK